MTGDTCVICGNTKARDPNVTFHRILRDAGRRVQWLEVFDICEDVLKESARDCCQHIPGGDCSKEPSITLSKCFASPRKKVLRAKQMRERKERRELSRSVMPSLP